MISAHLVQHNDVDLLNCRFMSSGSGVRIRETAG